MSWHDAAARLTERRAENKRYDSAGFAAILRRYDADASHTLSGAELAGLLNKMLGRYGQSVTSADAVAILGAYGLSEGASIATFARAVATQRGTGSETYTRLLSNMLARFEIIDCVNTDPFAPKGGGRSWLMDDICREELAAARPAAISAPLSIEVDPPAQQMVSDATVVSQPAHNPPSVIHDDPFAAFGSGQALTAAVAKTPLNTFERVMAHGGCKEHCDVEDVDLVNSRMFEETGRDFQPLFHDAYATDAADVRTAVALGAPVWAANELDEIPEHLFDPNRSFVPAPVFVRDHFYQSPLFGQAKGFKGAGDDPQAFIDAGDHKETHTPDPMASMVALETDGVSARLGGSYNIYRRADGSLQLSAARRLAGADDPDMPEFIRADMYKTLDAARTRGIGGTAVVQHLAAEPESPRAAVSPSAQLRLNPQFIHQGLHNSWGVGPYVRHTTGGGRTDAGISLDYTQLQGRKALAGLRTTAELGSDGLRLSGNLSSETHVFSRPTYAVTADVSAGRGAPAWSLGVEYSRPLSYRLALRGHSHLDSQGGASQFSLTAGPVWAMGKSNRLTGRVMADLQLASGQTPSWGVLPGVSYINPRHDYSVHLTAGARHQSGIGLTPDMNLSVIKVLEPTP